MTLSVSEFLRGLAVEKMTSADRAVAAIWWHEHFAQNACLSAKELGQLLQDSGYAKQNLSRLQEALRRDSRTAKCGNDGFRIRVNEIHELDEQYSTFVGHRKVPASDSVVPRELVSDTRTYIEKVVTQINVSFDFGLFDCCAVMCRRLLETLIIEVYEHLGRASELKGPDDHFKMFSGLLAHLMSDPSINLSRNCSQALNDFKKLGDLSAHSRRFNARAHDIERVRDGLRVAVEELTHLARLV